MSVSPVSEAQERHAADGADTDNPADCPPTQKQAREADGTTDDDVM